MKIGNVELVEPCLSKHRLLMRHYPSALNEDGVVTEVRGHYEDDKDREILIHKLLDKLSECSLKLI